MHPTVLNNRSLFPNKCNSLSRSSFTFQPSRARNPRSQVSFPNEHTSRQFQDRGSPAAVRARIRNRARTTKDYRIPEIDGSARKGQKRARGLISPSHDTAPAAGALFSYPPGRRPPRRGAATSGYRFYETCTEPWPINNAAGLDR